MQIVVADATEYEIPDDLTVAYFFRPFGEEPLSTVLRAIAASIDRNPRRVWLVYAWPMSSRSTVLATDRFRLVKEQRYSLIHRRKDGVAIFESC